MALERLQSVFNNIEDNKQSLDDGIPVESISNSLNDDIHSFGTQGNRSELIQITKIDKKQNPSPLVAINGIFAEDGTITPINPINGHNFRQIRINDNAGTNLLQTVGTEYSGDAGYGEVISNEPNLRLDKLGKGKYKLESLFDPTHGNVLEGRDAFLRSGIGSRRNLNIKAHSTFSRRGLLGIFPEPYITHNIPDKDSPGGTKVGYNRDSIPFRAAAEDLTRLGAYYTSPKGLLKLGAENITNLSIGDGFTFAEPFGSLLLPAIPIPMTGFLNNYQQRKQGSFQGIEYPGKLKSILGGLGFELKDFPTFGNSIRKPAVGEVSSMMGNPIQRPFVMALQGDIASVASLPGFSGETFLEKHLKKNRVELRKEKEAQEEQVRLQFGLGSDPNQELPGVGQTGLQKLGAGLNKIKEGSLDLASIAATKVRNAAVREIAKQSKKLLQLPPLIEQPSKRFLDLSGGGKRTNYVDNLSNETSVEIGGPEPPLEKNKHIDRGDFYLRIKDMRTTQFLYFRGYITGITENLTPTWNPTTYIGRSEDVWIYQKGERDISFNLRVAPANQTDFDIMYDKLDKLTSLVYPEYSGNRMNAPFTELYMAHIGSPAKGQFGYFKSITYTVNEQGDWDALTSRPRVFDIALSYQILHKKPPQVYLTQFYGAGVEKQVF